MSKINKNKELQDGIESSNELIARVTDKKKFYTENDSYSENDEINS